MSAFPRYRRCLRQVFPYWLRACGLVVGVLVLSGVGVLSGWSKDDRVELVPLSWEAKGHQRHLQSIDMTPNCTPPAIQQFPGGLFTQHERAHGAILVHILISIYMFIALAIVCDDYFVPSLEVMCDTLNLQSDVAGATFMAAGSSAPELATAVIAVFIAKDDIGVGTVVGSAVYNVTFVISICALFAGMVVQLHWWPLFRDCVFYTISIIALVLVIIDNQVMWYEALSFLILYGLYIVIMVYNRQLEAWVTRVLYCGRSHDLSESVMLYDKLPNDIQNGAILTESDPGKFTDTAQWREFPMNNNRKPDIGSSDDDSDDVDDTTAMISDSLHHPKAENDPKSVFSIPEGCARQVLWALLLPVTILLYISIPDCRKARFRRCFVLTFLMSLVWLSLFSYFSVWMITIIGETFGIPDSIMGLTFVAFGVSLPDAIASYLVAKEGYGDMAVSNAVGSNIFDILICLGIPWLLQTSVVTPGDYVEVYSRGLVYSSLTLMSTVIFLLVATHLNGWKLDKRYGVILLVVYVLFTVLASLYELNVFGDFNPPTCDITA